MRQCLTSLYGPKQNREILLALVKSLNLEFHTALINYCIEKKKTWTLFFFSHYQNYSQVLCQCCSCALSEELHMDHNDLWRTTS